MPRDHDGRWTFASLQPRHDHGTALTAGRAVLRVEFWRANVNEPGGNVESEPVLAGQAETAVVDFQPPAGTVLVKLTGYLVDAVGGATFDDFQLLDRTGPAIRTFGPAVSTAGDPATGAWK